MATSCVEEDLAVQAARILLTLKNRRLLRWPEWVEKEPATVLLEVGLSPEWRPKRERSGKRRPGKGDYRRVLKKLGLATSAGSSGEGRERSPRWRERPRAAARRPDSPAYDGTPSSGSGPSTTADRRPRHTVEKASAVSVAEPAKEPVMKVASPETPLELGASSAGSGASSSGDDAARPPSKRRAAPGSAASSGDEGCSSPDKRARLAIGDGDKAISEPKMEEAPAKFAFDLNLLPEDDKECPGF